MDVTADQSHTRIGARDQLSKQLTGCQVDDFELMYNDIIISLYINLNEFITI